MDTDTVRSLLFGRIHDCGTKKDLYLKNSKG
jgi:hypothetical protein